MICYLTSSPTIYPNTALNPANGFVERLRADLPGVMKCLFIASNPDDIWGTADYAQEMRTCLEGDGFEFASYRVLDRRNADEASALVAEADLIILAGGHVPTQNRFFTAMGLREIIRGFGGVVMGISAGTMNSADTVYSIPELDGEAVDPDYERTLKGLGLTDINIVPHYQYLETCMLDGMNMIHEIALSDSMTRRLYGLVDGAYLYIKDGESRFFGETLLMENGTIAKICEEGGSVLPIE